jgi:hypothetical protein
LVTVTLFLLFAVLPGLAQDLPDPGRRLTPEEQKADPEKRPPAKPAAGTPQRSERDEQACKSARIYYQLACGAPNSRREYSRDCAEANVLYEQNCR